MKGLPRPGDEVRFNDPWFYPGEGTVVRVQTEPHHAVLVKVSDMTGEVHRKHWVGREVWILPGNLELL